MNSQTGYVRTSQPLSRRVKSFWYRWDRRAAEHMAKRVVPGVRESRALPFFIVSGSSRSQARWR